VRGGAASLTFHAMNSVQEPRSHTSEELHRNGREDYNCQIGVFLAYASPKDRELIDWERYLPRSWTGEPERLAAAKVPEGTALDSGGSRPALPPGTLSLENITLSCWTGMRASP
jgi:hypothetical protein